MDVVGSRQRFPTPNPTYVTFSKTQWDAIFMAWKYSLSFGHRSGGNPTSLDQTQYLEKAASTTNVDQTQCLEKPASPEQPDGAHSMNCGDTYSEAS